MKKFLILIFLVFIISVIEGFYIYKIATKMSTAKIIQNIEVDGVDEVDKGIITLKINGEYYDYNY